MAAIIVDLPAPLGEEEKFDDRGIEVLDLLPFDDMSLLTSISKCCLFNPMKFESIRSRNFKPMSADMVLHFPNVLSQHSLKKLSEKGEIIRERSQRELFRAKEKKSRLQEIVESLFESQGGSSQHSSSRTRQKSYSTAELSSYGEFLALKEWRDVFVSSLMAMMPESGPVALSPASFGDLLYLYKICLKECFEDHDFANSKRLLDASFRIYSKIASVMELSSPRSSVQVEHLRQHVREAKIWSLPQFWAYYFLLELILRPVPRDRSNRQGPRIRSRSFDRKDDALSASANALTSLAIDIPKIDCSVVESEKWNHFVYSVAAAVFLTMHELGIEQAMVVKVMIQIAITQQMDEKRTTDLINLMQNMFRNKEIFEKTELAISTRSPGKGELKSSLLNPAERLMLSMRRPSLDLFPVKKLHHNSNIHPQTPVASRSRIESKEDSIRDDEVFQASRDRIVMEVRATMKERVQEIATELLKTVDIKKRRKSLTTRKSVVLDK
eukprot:TRINITY_DN56259_c1_g1_i2.p1 TRINITY_DN56259_c1_g1~~TRINITY_DN56259_c1_g1_i2.p1  ORF type:complete len:542 (+),score=117.58 TRINITY_DN56259_c1_g1_i2:138-1628(+)